MKRTRNSGAAVSRENTLRTEYEVFLSFREPDTRNGFTDCLYHDMIGAGIRVFRDDKELRVGKEISGELMQVLYISKVYIAIFSKRCASSSWCLRKLTHMVEHTSKSDGKKQILPVFYEVKPVDVKLRTGLYRNAMTKHKKKFGYDEVTQWEDALKEASEIKGWDLKARGHGELIRSIIQEVLIKLNAKHKNATEHLVEDHDQIEAIMKLPDIGSNGVRFVGIHGIGGIGKTTLTKVIFNKLYSCFEGCCFLEAVRESYQRDGPVYLQKQLLSSILNSSFIDQINNVDDGINMIRERLCSKKVLIVLDNLNKKEQLEKLAEKLSCSEPQ